MSEIFLVHEQQDSPAERRAYLEMAGYRVRTTTNALECLAWLREEIPALVIMDVLVEGKNGFDATRLIRDRHPVAEVPIILASRLYTEPEHAAEAERAGAQHYLYLPIAPDELLSVVGELVARRSDHAAA